MSKYVIVLLCLFVTNVTMLLCCTVTVILMLLRGIELPCYGVTNVTTLDFFYKQLRILSRTCVA